MLYRLEGAESDQGRATVGHQLVKPQVSLQSKLLTVLQTNSLTEITFSEALEKAQKLDEVLRTTGQIKGPLHGIPFTVKDQFNIKGRDTTLGYCGRAFQPAPENAVLVDLIEELGGVIFAKTNLPQSIMVSWISATMKAHVDHDSGVRLKIRFGV